MVIEHDMNLIMGLCGRIHVLDAGKTLATGPPDVIRDDPSVIEAYLGTPREGP
jgi:branched-chain amino acid transport system ATP-binding protein